MARHLIAFWVFVCAAHARPLPLGATLAPAPGTVCLASPERALAWLDGVVSRARSLGVPAVGIDVLGRTLDRDLGANLLSHHHWKKVGLDATRPVCLVGPLSGSERVIVTFSVADAKKVVDLARRIAMRRDASVGTPKSTSRKGARVWTFSSRKGDEVMALAVRDRKAFLAASGDDLSLLLERESEDPAAGWAFPEGEVVVVARFDLRAMGAATGDDGFVKAADMATPVVFGDFVVAGREARFQVRGKSVGLLALVGSAFERTLPDAGRRLIDRLDAGASGFVQVRLPMRLILEAIKTMEGTVLPSGWKDLAEALSGDLMIAGVDGLAGLTLAAGVNDEAAARRGITRIGMSLRASGLPVTVDDLALPQTTGFRFRWGAQDSPIRFSVLAVVRDGLLAVSLSRARLDVWTHAPTSRYVDALDHPLVREGLASGAFVVAHGYEADSLGSLLPYAAVVREAVDGQAPAWTDLFYLPALAADLLIDIGLAANLSSTEWSVGLVGRFLAADPGSREPGERLYAQAVRARMEGRLAAAREVLLALAQSGQGPHARKARRCLTQPEPVSDLLVGAVVAGSLFALHGSTAGPAETDDAFSGETQSEMSPCQQYLLESCLGKDPEGPACRRARAFFEDGRPTAEDQERCRSLLKVR